jgi:glycosyltransferase involved in cell wall biosynthesis
LKNAAAAEGIDGASSIVRILVLTDRYWPEIAAPSFRLHEHARIWVEEGHDVTVVTCVPNFPKGKVFDGYVHRLWQEETKDGVRIVRLWTYMTANEGIVKRTIDYASYTVAAIVAAPFFSSFDVVLASSPPFFVAIAGWGVSVLRRRPWVFEIRDLWPASIRAVGAKTGPVLGIVERLELFLYRRADRIISLTYSFRDDLARRGIPLDKNDVVTNGVDAACFAPHNATYDARAELGVARDGILAGYIGTVGMAHGLETIVEAASAIRERKDITILILGEGAERSRLEAEARNRGLTNLIFRDFVPHELMPSYLAALDLSIVHLRPDPLFKTVIPSKIFESMAMGIPIVMAVEGESAEIVRSAGAGICVSSGDPAALAAAVTTLADQKDERRRLGENGREAVRKTYGRRPLALAALHALEAAAGEPRGATR